MRNPHLQMSFELFKIAYEKKNKMLSPSTLQKRLHDEVQEEVQEIPRPPIAHAATQGQVWLDIQLATLLPTCVANQSVHGQDKDSLPVKPVVVVVVTP